MIKHAAACALAAAAFAATPVHSASAQYYYCGIVCGVGNLAAGVVGTAAAIATAPFRLLAPPPYAYYRAPAYYAPAPRAYYPPPAYYAPRPYYGPPGYYGQPGYYYGPR